MHSKRRPVRGAISKAKIWWKKTACLQIWVRMWRQVKMWRQNNAAPKCGFRHKCGGASEMMEMWLQTMWRRNVASSTNVVAPPKMTEMWRQTMWRQAQMWWQSEMWRQTMWRQAQMWWQSEMWRQTMWRQNVASDTPFAKLSSRKCVFKKRIQWQAQKCYTKCLCPAISYDIHNM